MNLREIEEKVGELDLDAGSEFLYALLRAYGIPKATVSRLEKGSSDKSQNDDERLLRGKVYYRSANLSDDDLYTAVDAAKSDDGVLRQRPRFAIVRNAQRLVAADLDTGDSLDIAVSELRNHVAFFLPWAGIEKTQIENLNLADVKAAEKMARLYDEIVKRNTVETEEQIHKLNVFFSRLLFCFFAEDTGVFERGSFTNAVGSLSRDDGRDLHELLDQLFDVLNAKPESRIGFPSYLLEFGYVNGKLFERHSSAPTFSAKARSLVLECGTLDWSQINPDIFGSMIQAVVHPGHRGKLGMHYTSVENIMKVIRPLFLDELERELTAARDSVARLDRLHDRLASIQVFDPACGSGNFLVIAYKELRQLEHGILERIAELEPSRRGLFALSRISLDNFYGIEIDDFAHEIAMLSLWLAKHQMNLEFEELFGVEIRLIPLKEAGNITCGNATRMDWRTVCNPDGSPTYVLGNPPYIGSSMQSRAQKGDFEAWFGSSKYPKKLDYISLWFLAASKYIQSSLSQVGFVSTSSISQGDHVGYLWPRLIKEGVEIAFAYEPFRWSNQARGKAGVICTVIGLRSVGSGRGAQLYGDNGRLDVPALSPYLVPGAKDLIVRRASKQLFGLPPMLTGCKLSDGGHLVLNNAQKDKILQEAPEAVSYIKRFMGGTELLNGVARWCLYIDDANLDRAMNVPEIATRLKRVREFRLASTEKSTRSMAEAPNRFYFDCYSHRPTLAVPSNTSGRRRYVPVAVAGQDTVISNTANVCVDAELWLFGLIQARLHMLWLSAVGGRLKADFRYSPVLVYNTFPVPELSSKVKGVLRGAAIDILATREQFSDLTLAELYDPDKMPAGLLQAHQKLDETVDRLYRPRPFESDEERLKVLFSMYEEMVTEQEAADA